MKNKMCPICEQGDLGTQWERIKVKHLDKTGQIKSHYKVCNNCGCQQVDADDARLNKRAMVAFKKEAQGLLTGKKVRTLRNEWGLNQDQAAKVFGGGPVAFSKYETDDVMQSEAMDKLLRLANDMPLALAQLKRDAGILSGAKNSEVVGVPGGVDDDSTNDWQTVEVKNGRYLSTLKIHLIESHDIDRREADYG